MAVPSPNPPTTHRGLVTGALLLSMFMAAIETTIVATAMPRIVADLGGFSHYSWVFTLYLLTQVVTIPLYGKLADLYGRKPVFTFGILLFMGASALCGLSRGMVPLIVFRTLQGIGSGAVQPIAITVVGDLYPAEERHRVQGYMSSVWAISAIVGPALGGFIVDFWHWSWVFYLNLPLGVLSVVGVWLYLKETPHPRRHSLDWPGALLLVVAVGALLLMLLQGGTSWAWLSGPSLGLAALGIASLLGLIAWEVRAPEPVFPLGLMRQRLILVAGLASFFNGALLMGYSAMVPTYVQGVLGASAIAAGFALATMSIGWPLASFLSGRLMKRVGFRRAALLGGALTVAGAVMLVAIAGAGVPGIAASMALVGMGLGFMSNALIITVQSAVGWQQRGVATANVLFMRTLGSTVGAALLGSMLNQSLVLHLRATRLASQLSPGHILDLINQLLDPTRARALGASHQILSLALGQGMQGVFAMAVALAALGALTAWWLPASAPPPEATAS